MSPPSQQQTAAQGPTVASVIRVLLVYFRLLFDHLLDLVFSWFERRPVQEQKFFRITNPLLLESATALARKIRRRELTSEQVVRAYIERINFVNALINALVDTCFERALDEARKIDSDIDAGKYSDADFDAKPFLGVPFTTKESTACKGLSWTFGIYPRANIKADEDATVVANLRNAGGILLGVSNIPQLNLWVESSNPLYGRTNNPYDLSRNVGGSSGGEAAIIAACASPFGIGTDIGGSIRIPSFMCGVFGHKTSPMLTPTKGLTFRDGTVCETMMSAGPMVRHAVDLVPMLKAILGEAPCKKLQLDKPVDIKKIKYSYMMDIGDVMISPLRTETKDFFNKVIGHLDQVATHKCKEVNFEYFRFGRKLYRFWLTQEKNFNFSHDLNNRQGNASLGMECLKYATRNEANTLAVILGILNNDVLPKVDATWAKDITKKLKDEILAVLGTDGVFLFPSAPFPARRHHSNYLQIYNFIYFAIFNILKLPVTQVPIGLGKEGLPHGIQVVAGPYQDHLCLAVARELEDAFGGFRPPALIDFK